MIERIIGNVLARVSAALIVAAALLPVFDLTPAMAAPDSPGAEADLTVLKIDAPIVAAPAGFPPFPAKVDLPVSLRKETNQEAVGDYLSATSAEAGPELGNASQPHAALAQSMLSAHRVVDGFQELKKAVELNNWKAGDQPNQATCHRLLAEILMEYALKAKTTGRGTRGMQRLLNAYIECRQSVFLDPSDNSARVGLVNVSKEIVGIQPSFDNILALGSANLLSGNNSGAEYCYKKCLELGQLNSTIIPSERRQEVAEQLAKLQAEKSAQSAASQSGEREPSQPAPYVHHALAKFGKTDKSVTVPDVDETIKVDPYGTANFYVANARRILSKEWYLSQIQTSQFPSIAFAVDKRGDITELRIEKSSGNALVDEAALNVARRVAPFPNAPSEIGEISCTFENKKEPVDLSDYMRQLRRKIRHNWHPPHDLQEDHIVASFKVHRDGSVDNLVLKQSSASELRNKASLEAIRNSSPFAHFPQGALESCEVQFHFDHAVESAQSEN